MERIGRDDLLMRFAELVGKRGTCSRLQVGAVFSKEGRVIVTGYNGAPAGLPHCDHSCDCEPTLEYMHDMWHGLRSGVGPRTVIHDPFCHSIQPCEIAAHAEQNGVAFAAKHGLALDKSELHVTYAPCLSCAKSIINAGVIRVSYALAYRLPEGVELLGTAGLEVVEASAEKW
jgi:dCMP deaminase